MDDLESRLSSDLTATTRDMIAGPGLDAAVKKRVRRRQALASITAAVPVLLLIVGAVWLLNLSDDDGAIDLDIVDDPEPDAPIVDAEPLPPPTDALHDALVDLGADVDGAPTVAVTLGDAEFCGTDRVELLDGGIEPIETAQCLISASAELRDAVMIRVQTTIEGDPIVTVVWTRDRPFETDVHVDTSQDNQGARGWISLECDLIIFNGDDHTPPLSWDNCRDPDSDPPVDITPIPLSAGSRTNVEWPDQSFFFDAVDELDLFIITDGNPDTATRSWAHVGAATRNEDGTSTISLVAPAGLATLSGREFSVATAGPISDGTYDLVLAFSTSAITQIEFIGSANSGGADFGGFLFPTDEETAILGGDGLADAVWGDTAADVLPGFAARFGPPRRDEVLVKCLTLRTVEYDNGLRVWFSSDTDFNLENPDQAGLTGYRYDGSDGTAQLTTRDGVAIGSPLSDIIFLDGGFNGGYDSPWGAYGWFLDGFQGGLLTHDMTDPRARVASIGAGALGSPDRMDC